VADRDHAQLLAVRGDPLEKRWQHALVVSALRASTDDPAVDQAPAVRIGHEEPGIGADPLDLPAIAQGEIRPTALDGEQRELDAR
jgi:hypothetical protein